MKRSACALFIPESPLGRITTRNPRGDEAEMRLPTPRRQATTEGMRALRLAGALKVAKGLTTIEEILATTPPLS